MKRELWHLGIFLFFSYTFVYSQPTEEKLFSDFFLEIFLDQRIFPNTGIIPLQKEYYPSLAINPEFTIEWDQGSQLFQFSGFARWEQGNTRRSHWDIQELYWMRVQDQWELSLGFKKVFWGVTEAIHLVDIINQTDFIESFDGEQKLGQPMLHYSRLTKIGTFDFFAMPYFRKRQFSGPEGRFQTLFPLEKSDVLFEADLEEWHPSFAFRWAHSLGSFDLDLSHFYGVGREPIFVVVEGSSSFQGIYPKINQTGLALQYIAGPAIYKLESIYRQSDLQNTFALAAGLEYTFSNVAGSGLDLGLLGEYLYDSRDEWALSAMDNDLFVGTRLGFNDVHNTQMLAGAVFDLEHSSRILSLEASRRVGQQWKVELEGRLFGKIDNTEFLHFFRRDSFLQFRLVRYF